MADLVDLGEVIHDAYQALAHYLYHPTRPLDARPGTLTETFAHLGDVREGFQLALRVGDVRRLSELHALVQRFLVDWRWLEEQGFTTLPSDEVQRLRTQLLAFAHACTAFAILPQLPRERITFPGRRTYADIPIPRTPGETLERIEELERVLTRASIQPRPSLQGEPLRRTFGYFEASAWLIHDYRRQTRM